jgi:hypothetical protein
MFMLEMIRDLDVDGAVATTGHRPAKLGGYGEDTFARLTEFVAEMLDLIGASHIISGLSPGWEMAICLAAQEREIPFTAALAVENYDKRWPDEWRERYRALLNRSTNVWSAGGGPYTYNAMVRRNEWTVENCKFVVSMWEGNEGGIANCAASAAKYRRPVLNLWNRWAAYAESMI